MEAHPTNFDRNVPPYSERNISLTVSTRAKNLKWEKGSNGPWSVDPIPEAPGRIWTGSTEVLTENGSLTHSGIQIIPKCPILASKSSELFKPSTITVRSFLEHVLQRNLTHNFNSEEKLLDKDIQAAVVSKYSNSWLMKRMRQCLYDWCSARKRAGRDDFFESKGYDRPFSRHSFVTEEDIAKKSIQVDMGKENVFRTIPRSTALEVGCVWWRTALIWRLERSSTAEIPETS